MSRDCRSSATPPVTALRRPAKIQQEKREKREVQAMHSPKETRGWSDRAARG